MTIEDVGLEPDFNVEEKKQPKKKKNKAVKTEIKVEELSQEQKESPKKKKKAKKRANQAVKEENEEAKASKPKKVKKEVKKDTDETPVETAPAVQKSMKAHKKQKGEKLDRKDAKFAELLKRLLETSIAFKAREELGKEVAEGRLTETESQNVFKTWRKQQKHKAAQKELGKLIQLGGKLEDVQAAADELIKKRRISPYQSRDAIRKWQSRENRRLGRQEKKLAGNFCFNCRKGGHLLADCPEDSNTSGICFKCGSGEHSVHKCPRKHVKGMPFATCFVCNQQGHLSKDCEQNKNGIYPDGGSCNVCGSQKHLKRDCPELAAQKKGEVEKKIVAQALTADSRPDDDYETVEVTPAVQNSSKKKKSKVVKF